MKFEAGAGELWFTSMDKVVQGRRLSRYLVAQVFTTMNKANLVVLVLLKYGLNILLHAVA